jgi:hypothetical protein
VDFIATDMPHADKFTVGIMALVAEKERDMISQRTRDGLAAAKGRGIKLGNPRPAQALKVAQIANSARADAHAQSLLPMMQEIRAAHVASRWQAAAIPRYWRLCSGIPLGHGLEECTQLSRVEFVISAHTAAKVEAKRLNGSDGLGAVLASQQERRNRRRHRGRNLDDAFLGYDTGAAGHGRDEAKG